MLGFCFWALTMRSSMSYSDQSLLMILCCWWLLWKRCVILNMGTMCSSLPCFLGIFSHSFFITLPCTIGLQHLHYNSLYQCPVSHGWQECAQASMMAGAIEIPSDYGVCCGKRVMHCGCVYVQALWQLLWVLNSKGPTGPVQKHVTTPPRIFSSLSFRQRISSVASRVLAEVCTLL